MKKVLIQCVHRPNRSPSQRFRFEQYVPFLEGNGYRINFSYLLNEKQDKVFYKPGRYLAKAGILLKSTWRRWTELLSASKYDLLLVQREGYMLGTPFFEKRLARKMPMIFDFDDSIWMQKVSEGNRKLGFLKKAGKTSDLIEAAKMVWPGNEYLAAYARKYNANVAVVPTTIDTDVYKKVPAERNRAVCIGWSGSFSTLEHFETAVPVLKKIKEKYGDRVSFTVIGDDRYRCEELAIQGKPWTAESEIQELSKIDIGIMPLPDDEWASGKCGLKGLQYMALGIPTLMSPVGVNKTIVQNGVNGFLPSTQEEWVACLSLLIEDEALRESMGEAGRQTVKEHYSVDAWKQTYLDYFNQLTSKK